MLGVHLGASLHLTTLFGIPVRLHWSFLGLLAGLLLWVGPSSWVGTLGVVTGLFGSVLLHELGHALAARVYGIETAHITLYPFGGIAAITRMPRNPFQELVIAVAGPAVNLGLALLFGGLALAYGGWVGWWLALLNLGMGAFNLIPAYPMDGGRVLRALLATRMGWMRASALAIRIGYGFAWAFIAFGVLSFSFNLVLVGGFLLVALGSERQRLVQMAWERKAWGHTDWDSPNPWGSRRAPYGR